MLLILYDEMVSMSVIGFRSWTLNPWIRPSDVPTKANFESTFRQFAFLIFRFSSCVRVILELTN